MILSVSRKTDIPAFHFDWFLQRVKEGYVINRNPMFPQQLYKTPIQPLSCDCIVFWTKNAIPAIEKLDALRQYQYYFQYTVTGYDRDIERNLPDKKWIRENFKALSDKMAKENRMSEKEADKIIVDCVENGIKSINLDV